MAALSGWRAGARFAVLALAAAPTPAASAAGEHRTLPGGFAPNEEHDPTFELYSPPYLFRGPRPEIARPRRASATAAS